MATLKMRYGGNIISLPEGANFSPGNFGTARLKYRVNSSSVGELGLTTNTNAKEYCGLKMRVGGQVCYIGRVSTTSYISGNTVDYHGSSMGSRSIQSVSVSESKQSNVTLPIDYYSSSMATSTSMYTQVTSTQQIETRSYTQEVWSRSETGTANSGSGSGTSDTQPSKRTVTNATGSTVTSSTVSGKVLTNSSYKETHAMLEVWYWTAITCNRDHNHNVQGAGSVVSGRTLSSRTNKYTAEFWNSKTKTSTKSSAWNDYGTFKNVISVVSSANGGSGGPTLVNSTYINNTSQTLYGSSHSWYTKWKINTYTRAARTVTTATYNNKKYTSSGTLTGSTTYGSYSTRYTYYWSSCKIVTNNYYSTRTVREYSTRSYTGTTYYTSITRSTTSVSETIHNMNV